MPKKMFLSEKIFADLLDSQGFEWEYEPKRFQLDKTTYCPDFYVPSEDVFYEVVGTRQAFHAIRPKVELMAQFYPSILLKTVNPDGSPYRNRTWDGEKRNPMLSDAVDIRVRIPQAMIEQIDLMAAATPNVTRSSIIRSLLRDGIQQITEEEGEKKT